MLEVIQGFLKDTVEYQKWGVNIATIGALGTVFFTVLQSYGLLRQNNDIWEKESGESVSVSLFGYYLFYLIAFLIYGVEKKSIAIIFNGLLFLPCVPIIAGLYRFKKFTVCEKIGFWLFTGMPVTMHFFKWKETMLLIFLFGIAIFLLIQVYEIWKEKSVGNLDFRMLVIFFLTSMFWTIYAIAIGDVALMIFNPLALGIYIATFFFWAKYRKREPGRAGFPKERGRPILDLQTSDVGMTCDEFTTLTIAGAENLPPEVRKRRREHSAACFYHRTRGFYQEALASPVTPEIKEAAGEIILKYSEGGSSHCA